MQTRTIFRDKRFELKKPEFEEVFWWSQRQNHQKCTTDEGDEVGLQKVTESEATLSTDRHVPIMKGGGQYKNCAVKSQNLSFQHNNCTFLTLTPNLRPYLGCPT